MFRDVEMNRGSFAVGSKMELCAFPPRDFHSNVIASRFTSQPKHSVNTFCLSLSGGIALFCSAHTVHAFKKSPVPNREITHISAGLDSSRGETVSRENTQLMDRVIYYHPLKNDGV